jgi:hypothetical protein
LEEVLFFFLFFFSFSPFFSFCPFFSLGTYNMSHMQNKPLLEDSADDIALEMTGGEPEQPEEVEGEVEEQVEIAMAREMSAGESAMFKKLPTLLKNANSGLDRAIVFELETRLKMQHGIDSGSFSSGAVLSHNYDQVMRVAKHVMKQVYVGNAFCTKFPERISQDMVEDFQALKDRFEVWWNRLGAVFQGLRNETVIPVSPEEMQTLDQLKHLLPDQVIPFCCGVKCECCKMSRGAFLAMNIFVSIVCIVFIIVIKIYASH